MKLLIKSLLVCGAIASSAVACYGAALQFDGTDDYVRATAAPNLANSSFTVEAWARRGSANSIDFILGQGSAGTSVGMHFGFHYAGTVVNKFVFGFYYDDLFTADAYTDNDWHHWAGTYNAATKARAIYRDGVLIASANAAANYQGTGPLILGDSSWGGPHSMV